MFKQKNNYSIETDTHSEGFSTKSPSLMYDIHQSQGFLGSHEIYPNEMGTILKHNFQYMSYPTDLTYINPFCPLCLHYVHQQQTFLGYYSAIFGKTYLAHQFCLKIENNNCLNTIMQQITHSKLSLTNIVDETQALQIGQKQYFIQVEIAHPITNKIFFTVRNKIKTHESTITWNFSQNHQPSFCFPNIVAFPYPDFDINIIFNEMSEKNSKTRFHSFANLQKIQNSEDKFVKIEHQQFELIVRIINNPKEKQKIVQDMNFKYTHPLNINFPLIQLIKLQVKIPQDQSDDEQYFSNHENSSITELLNENSQDNSTVKSNDIYQKKENKQISDNTQGQWAGEKQKVDLNKLISTKRLSQYVRNNTQSRNFQAYLCDVSSDQITKILNALSNEICELITHEYANYMMQKLFTLCSPDQRLFILEKLLKNIPNLVKNKQGTHTLQTFIALFTQKQQCTLVINSVKKYLYELSSHPNGTYFIQKLITTFSIQYIMPYFHIVSDQFVDFSLNKNAMCVLKQMMIKVKEICSNGYYTSKEYQLQIMEIKKRFINLVTMNLDKVIQNCFGNYVVQFCYQLFGQQNCEGITQMIIQRFPQFSMQKFSGNVVFKCLDSYWTNKQTIQRLKYVLNNNAIMNLHKNKEGNKVLLIIMEKYEHTTIREKIYSQLLMSQPTKFLQDRWGITMGCRSGVVGTKWTSFTDAVKPSLNKKKKYYNNIH